MVLGLGNVQWGDAGAGMQAFARLQAHWVYPAQVAFVEGGTRGRALVPLLQASQRLLVLSAIEMGAAPGTLRVLTGDAAAEQLYVRHPKRPGMDFADALACSQIDRAVDTARHWLQRWRIEPLARAAARTG